MPQGSRIKPVVARAEGWFAVFGRKWGNARSTGSQIHGVLTVYVQEGVREYIKKKEKKIIFFLSTCVSFLVLRLFSDLLIRGFYKENCFYGF